VPECGLQKAEADRPAGQFEEAVFNPTVPIRPQPEPVPPGDEPLDRLPGRRPPVFVRPPNARDQSIVPLSSTR